MQFSTAGCAPPFTPSLLAFRGVIELLSLLPQTYGSQQVARLHREAALSLIHQYEAAVSADADALDFLADRGLIPEDLLAVAEYLLDRADGMDVGARH
ncbi:hypothetical protein [Methylobacterium platani]|nr:hypothetical protein [Methylobacterium platani]